MVLMNPIVKMVVYGIRGPLTWVNELVSGIIMEGKYFMPTNITPHNENGLPHGYWEVYHDNGNLSYKGTHINSLRHGYWEAYWDNGNLGLVINYLNGKKVGLYISYHSNGALDKKIFYAD